MRASAILCLLCLALAPSGSAAASDFWDAVKNPELRQYRAAVARAREAHGERHFDEALAALDGAVALLPDRAEAHARRALTLFELGRREEGLEAARHALDLSEGALDPVEVGGAVAEEAALGGEHALAARVLGRVLARLSSSARRQQLYGLRGDCLLTLGPDHLRDALLALREAYRASRGGDPRAALGLALALRRSGETVESMDLARGVATTSRPSVLVTDIPVPPAEQAARLALALTAAGDLDGARTQWTAAADGAAWGDFAREMLAALDALPRAATRRGP